MTTITRRRSRRGSDDGQPHPIDIHVGKRVRLRRTLLGMTQEKLAEGIGLTFQQIQKYERGANRIAASRLFQFAEILDVPLSFFFDDMPDAVPRPGITQDENASLGKREILELARAFDRIKGERVRKSVLDMVRTLGRAEAE